MISQLFMTPLSAHVVGGAKGADTILGSDPYGITVTVISVSVVLLALIVLALLIWGFSRVITSLEKRQSEESRKRSLRTPNAVVHDVEDESNGEVIVAIALALKLHKEDLHDRESEVITLNSVARVYSPWSSKIHGLTNMPR
ncbi:MAG: OadG family transporter subunit [Rikenellaceae bacterium]